MDFSFYKPKGQIIACDLRQDIYNAELRGRIDTDLGSYKIHHFTHRDDDVIYTGIETSGKEEFSGWEWHPFEAKGSRSGDPGDERYGQAYAPYKKLKNPEHKREKHGDIYAGVQDLTARRVLCNSLEGEVRLAKTEPVYWLQFKTAYPEKTAAGEAVRIINLARKSIENRPAGMDG